MSKFLLSVIKIGFGTYMISDQLTSISFLLSTLIFDDPCERCRGYFPGSNISTFTPLRR